MPVGVCDGNQDDHCCWVPGPNGSSPCDHLVDNGPGGLRRWSCGLRERLGSWEAVRASAAYQASPGAVWDAIGQEHCDVYPTNVRCGNCGYTPVEVT